MAATEPTAQTGKRLIAVQHVPMLTDGHVVYAVPNHIEKAVALACEALHVSRPELEAMGPPEFYYNYNVWVLRQSGAIMVWNDFFIAGGELTRPQQAMLRKLKLSGLYKGPVHNKIY